MPIILSGPSKRRVTSTKNLIFSRGQAAGAAFDTALESNPVALLRKTTELDRLEQPRLAPPLAQARTIENPGLTQIQAQDRAKKEGFTWDSGNTTEAAFQFISERKKVQAKRSAIMGGAPQDLAQMGINFTAMLGASVVDPINIASAFIPVVGATRWMIAGSKALRGATLATAAISAKAIPMLAKYEQFGRAAKGLSKAQRLAFAGKVGLAEGLVGAAVVEPLVYTQANRLQDDYTFADSAINILVGTTLGGALHIGGTALTGRLPGVEARPSFYKLLDRDTPLPVREAVARSAVVQVTEGRVVDVEDLLVNEREMALSERLSTAEGIEREAIANRLESLSEQVVAAKRAGYLKPEDYSPSKITDLNQRILRLEERLDQIKGSKSKLRIKERKQLLATREALLSEARYAADIRQQVQLVEALKSGVVPKALRREIDALIEDIAVPTRDEINQRVIDRIEGMKSRSEGPGLSNESISTVEEISTVDTTPSTPEANVQAAVDERLALQEDAEAAGVQWDSPEVKAAEKAETDLAESIRRANEYMACRRAHG